MAVEKNPFEKIEKVNTDVKEMTQGLPGVDVNVNPDQEEELAVDVDTETGEVSVDLNEDAGSVLASLKEFHGNIAEYMDEEDLTDISTTVLDNFAADKESRQEWEQTFERGFDLLGLKLEETTEPFDGACTATHPLIIENAVKFQSKAAQELFPAKGPVKTQILGNPTPEKEAQAKRVKDFMNYQLTEEMPEYFDEMERMLFHLPLIGTSIKKVYYDETTGRPISEFIPIDQFHVSNLTPDLRRADRYTHLIYRTANELTKDMNVGMYRDCDLGEPSQEERGMITAKADQIMGLSAYEEEPYDTSHVLLEQHLYLDLPEPFNSPNGEAWPYIVTVDKSSKKILSIRRNWNDGDSRHIKREHFVAYKFVPSFGFYGLGLLHFLGNLTMSATAAMRALVDAGQFANLPGGFKARGVRVVGDNTPIMPGEFRDVESTGIDLNKSIVPLPYKEPSQVLFQMLGFLATAGQKFADTTEQVVSDATNYGPVGTTLALLEASGKFFSAIHKRLHKSQRDEFKILARINYEFLPPQYPYDIVGGQVEIKKQDFDGRVDVVPVSDPNVPSSAHRLAQSQLIFQMASQATPGTFNMQEVYKSVLTSANVDNPERFIIQKPPSQPQDPVADIMLVSQGKPIKAFPGQDHDAHIQVKSAYVQDPLNGANPVMKQIVPILLANIREHMVLRFQEQMGGLMKNKEGQVDQGATMGMIMAESAKQILEANKLKAQGGLDSVEQQNIDLQKQHLELDKVQKGIDAQKIAAELNFKDRELDLKSKEVDIDAMVEAAKIEDAKKKNNDQLTSKVVMDLLKLVGQQNTKQPPINLAPGGQVPTASFMADSSKTGQQMANMVDPGTQAAQAMMLAADAVGKGGPMSDVAPPTDKLRDMGSPTISTPTPTESPAPEMTDEQTTKEVFGDIPETVGEGTTTEGIEVPEVMTSNFIIDEALNRLQIQDKDKAKANLDVFTEIVSEMESDKNPQAKNPKSTAAGLFQYTKPSLVTAKQRYKNIAERVGIEEIPESIEKAKDARELTPEEQTTLFYADTFEKPGSDKYMKEILEAPDYETLTTATQKLYNELHHTDAKKQENERFAKVAMRVGGRVNLT